METNTNTAVDSKANERKPSKLQGLKSLNGLIKKAETEKWATETELKVLKEMSKRLRGEVLAEL